MNHDGVNDEKLPFPGRIRTEGEKGVGTRTRDMQEVERRLLELSERFRKPLGMSRRSFLQSSSGMAAGFLAMNSVFGSLFSVSEAEATDPKAAEERRRALDGQIIFDIQTHFVSPDYPSKGILSLRELAKRWNPKLKGPQRIEDILFENFFHEIFESSETSLAVLSNAPNDDSERWFISNQEAFQARERLNARVGAKKLYVHAVVTPGQPGWIDDLEQMIERKPDAWKGYTTGQPAGTSRWPWRLDDEDLVYPAYEKMVRAGIRTVCIHKGLLPSSYKRTMTNTWHYANVDDLPKAAKDWPQLDFLIYHSAIRSGGIPTADVLNTFEETGYIPWVSDLARIPKEHGVNNVYAELGSVFAVTALSAPRYCAGIFGTLLEGMGEEHVLWGTDSVWYGSPQWQIEAFRRLEMPEDLQERFGYPALGPARGPLKNKVFAENARPFYPFNPQQIKRQAAKGR